MKHQTLGYVLPTGIYFEPFFRSDKKLSFKLKAGAGIAYISNPYDSIHNTQNWAYSMKIIGHAFLGLGVNFRLSNHLSSGFSTQLHHFSNGGIKEPNKGLNIPAIAIDISYCINPIAESKSKINKQPYRKKTWYELGVFDALQSDNHYKRLHVYGTWISFSKQISRINALSVGSEIIINTYNRTYIKKSITPETDHKRMNCLLGHEFRMGKVVFSQSIGIYIYSPYQAKEVLYQRYGLSYYFRNKLFTGVNLKAHRHVGDFIDFRIGYSIPK